MHGPLYFSKVLSCISYALLRKTAFDEKYRTCWSRRLESSIWLLTFFLLLSRDYRPPLFKHLTSSLSPIIMKSVVLLSSRPPVLIGARPRQTTWQKSIYTKVRAHNGNSCGGVSCQQGSRKESINSQWVFHLQWQWRGGISTPQGGGMQPNIRRPDV